MRGSDLSIGVMVSLCAHFVVGVLGLGTVLSGLDLEIVPEFRHGISSIEINLSTLAMPKQEPEIKQSEPDDPAVLLEEEPDLPEKQHEIPEEVLLDEGVEQADPDVVTDVKPSYPLGARIRGEEGAVKLSVWIDSSGRAKRVDVLESSGYPSLDSAAIKAARKAAYRDSDGALVSSRETTVSFRFQLRD